MVSSHLPAASVAVGNVMKGAKVVVVEDEEDIQEILEFTLTREGCKVTSVTTGTSATSKIRQIMPDLVLLDLMLPDRDGLDICRELKEADETRDIAIIMVTAKGEEADIVLGLGLGADDYIPKPFKTAELVARVKSVLRRTSRPPEVDDESRVLVHGSLRIDPVRHKVWNNEELLPLTATEFKILHLLASHPGRVFTRGQVLTAGRGESSAFDRTVDAHVRNLRRKLGELRDLIETVHAIGYRFSETAS